MRAPKDCHGCTRYDADNITDLSKDEGASRAKQWAKVEHRHHG